jgi:hypothetical protein
MDTARRVLTALSLFPDSICVSSRPQLRSMARSHEVSVIRGNEERAEDTCHESGEFEELVGMIRWEERKL